MARKAKIEIRHNTRGPQRFWYAVVGGNGETMTSSETFDSRAKAVTRAKRHLDVVQALSCDDIVDAD